MHRIYQKHHKSFAKYLEYKTVLYILNIFIFVVFVNSNLSLSQTINWEKAYKRSGEITNNFGKDVCIQSNGNILVVDYVQYPQGTFLLNINASGSIIDSLFIPGFVGQCCSPTTDDGCIILGYRSHIEAIMINSLFQIQWDKEYLNTNTSICYKIIKTNNNQYIGCGKMGWEGFVIKIDQYGEKIWFKTYGSGFYREFINICEANDEGYVLTGHTTESQYSNTYGSFYKIDTSGNYIFEKLYNFVYDMSIDKLASGYIMGASFYDSLISKKYIGFIRADNQGNIIKKLSFARMQDYQLVHNDGRVLNENKFIFLNYKIRYTEDTVQSYILVTDSNGTILNFKTYLTTDYNILRKIYPTNNNNRFLIVGSSNHINNQLKNVYVVSCDSNLYSPPVGIFNNGQFLPKRFTVVEAYPNPFNNTVKISIDIAETGDFKLVIYDIVGNEVKILHNGRMLTGKRTMNLELSRCSSGIYFVSLSGKGVKEIKKIVLLK